MAQIVYETTGGIMPRNLYRYEAALEDLSDYGITGKKATHPLLYCMAMLGEVKHRSHVFHFSEPSEEEQIEVPETVSAEELQQRIRELQQENKQLRQASHEAGRDVAETKHHVPVRYFSYASATKCAEQIVWDDRDSLLVH